jgi:hypothetical protein
VDSILDWLTKYSPPIVLLIGLGAVFLFAFKNITENAISAQFDQYKKEVELRLQRRSNFEERILLDRYTILRDIQSRIQRVMTDLRRSPRPASPGQKAPADLAWRCSTRAA